MAVPYKDFEKKHGKPALPPLQQRAEQLASAVEAQLDAVIQDHEQGVECVHVYPAPFDAALFGLAHKMLQERFCAAGWQNVEMGRISVVGSQTHVQFTLQPPLP
jgi:hypothetical protein